MALTADTLIELPFQKKLIALVVVIVVILGLYLYLSYVPKRAEIQSKDDEINKLTNEKAEKEIIAANLDAFKKEYEKLDAKLAQAVKMLPNEREIPELLFSVSNLVEQSGLELEVFEPLPEVPQEFYAEVPVSINVKGEFTQLAVFLDKLGKLHRIVNLTDLSVTKTDTQAGGFVALAAKGKITTYRFLQAGAG
ncbi:MAG: type 4a pilus biogenesis protein PilO [Deltaproteobacteria bacterium]|nr:type 4a pilus biogenesis protein PilO [Deltaproteobacteria bacterium]